MQEPVVAEYPAAMIEVAESQEYPAIPCKGAEHPAGERALPPKGRPSAWRAGCLGRWDNISRTATYHLCGALSLRRRALVAVLSLRPSCPWTRWRRRALASAHRGRAGLPMLFVAMNASTRKVHGVFFALFDGKSANQLESVLKLQTCVQNVKIVN